ncbi:MAG: Gfo/Idh/MocA family oxidoreductase [Acidobacteria bacterium]|nr:Gfo/Idh/MocA family oxidoreductase [Acidobacteriota bacterium]MBV9437923.1 Gfo/Idh/MocA family oxidoreductase [Acidobacteriota bacterium]
MVRFGILGFGLHAVRRLMPGFEQAKRSTVTGLWRRDRTRAEQVVRDYRQFSLRAYDTPEELCTSSDVDAIFVASPDALHLAHVLLAIKHHKPVLCEKPMAMNAAECERMVAAASQADVLLGVAQNFRFNRSVLRMKELVQQGKIGRPLLARSEFFYPARNSPRTWIADASLACGGPIGDVAVHCIDTLRFVLDDEVVLVCARAVSDEYSGSLECAATILLEFQKGTSASVQVSARAEYRTPFWISGEGGLLGGENALTVDHPIELKLKTLSAAEIKETISNGDAYARQVDAFAESVEHGVPFASPGIDGLQNQRILDAAYRSVKSGKCETP